MGTVAGGAGARTPSARPSKPSSAAITPAVSNDGASGRMPSALIRPWVGRRPYSPHAAAGARTEPPVSVPRPSRARPPATAAAGPEEEPQVKRSG